MPLTTDGCNLMLDALNGTNPTTPITHGSLHTAAPGDTGTNEATGGAPAYARKSLTFSTAAAKNLDSSNTPVFDVASGVTISHVGFFSAITGGTFLAWADVTDEAFGAQGTYTLTDADITLS
jgi:hypothetical protein